jgi:hypothetical protein
MSIGQPFGATYEDSQSPAGSFRAGVTAPALTPITANIEYGGWQVNDIGYFPIQVRHRSAKGGVVIPHVHFLFAEQPTAGKTIRFELYYIYAPINAKFSAQQGPFYADYTVPAADDIYHRVVAFASAPVALDATAPRSEAFICSVKRLTTGASESNKDPIVMFVDFHVPENAFGTITEDA